GRGEGGGMEGWVVAGVGWRPRRRPRYAAAAGRRWWRRWPRRWLGSGTSPGASRPSASERQEEGEMSREENRSTLDGNTAGGLLREVFAFDATAARITCAGCARIVPMGELRLYAIELGAILRCPSCDEAVVRIGRTPRGLWLDLRRAATVVTVSAGAP